MLRYFSDFIESIKNGDEEKILEVRQEGTKKIIKEAMRILQYDAPQAILFLREQVPYELERRKLEKKAEELTSALQAFFLGWGD